MASNATAEASPAGQQEEALPQPSQLPQTSHLETEEEDNDDNTSRTTNTKSHHHDQIVIHNSNSNSNRNTTLKHSNGSSTDENHETNSNGSDKDGSGKNPSSFEINCSPLPVSGTGSSYYEETRKRRKSLQKQKEQEDGESSETTAEPNQESSSGETKNYRLQPLKGNEDDEDGGIIPQSKIIQTAAEIDNAQPTHIIPNTIENGEDENDCATKRQATNNNNNDNSDEDDETCDADSCCTILDSGLSFHHDTYTSNSNTVTSIDPEDEEDNTISTSKRSGSTNMDTNSNTSTNTSTNQTLSESQTMQNSSVISVSTTRSVGSANSRGEEHITSRMKKYGLFNLQDMKRKQQQRRARSNTMPQISPNRNSTNNHSPTPPSQKTSVASCSVQQPLSVNSGVTEGMTEASSIQNSNGIIINNGNNTKNAPNLPRTSSERFQTKSHPNTVEDTSPNVEGVPTKIRTAPLHVQMAVEEIHRWLFTEGGHFEDVQTLMTQYSLYVREHFGIPLDRLYYGGVGLHPKLTAYLWKWEAHGDFTHAEMPPHVFARRNEIFSPDEPFCVLEQGRADHVRIRHTDEYIPPDTAKWFRGCHYKDYFALPDIHRGVSKGGLAWSTKSNDGFCDDDIQFFRMTHAALTTIMRLHTNDLVLNTLTDRMEAEIEDRTNELAIANAKLEEANEEISKHASKQLEHFACMSHEIRTPLNCIVGLSSLLLENEDLSDNEDLMDTIHMVYNSADLVQGVVNDVLDYAKIESGHFELDVKPSDLQSTLNGVVHSIQNKLVDKNVEVRTSYSGLLGKQMTTDSRRLQQILYNILGNAAKFSREGTTIDFKVKLILVVDNNKKDETAETNAKNNIDEKASATPTAKQMIRFSIKDYGKGIEEKNFEKIFQPFSQASKETQTVYGGTGLGLSITKNLVARLGGTISIRSEIDKFTEFIVDLPYEEEQVIDVSHYRKKLSETSIVILDPHNNNINKVKKHAFETDSENEDDLDDSFLPFPKMVRHQYGLSVLRCSSWGELESKLGLRANIRQNYFIIAHEDIEERQGILNVEKLVRRERCSWFSFGSDGLSSNRKYHFKTLTGIFPSALLDSLLDGAALQRETLNFPGSSSVDSSFSSLGSKSLGEELGAEEASTILQKSQDSGSPRSLSPPNTTTASVSSAEASKDTGSRGSGSSKSKKKFATKYPPRNLKVLIVDDNVINQKVLDRILKRLGVTDISIVNNGKKAVDISKSTRFDCIFMDMEMPIMGGLQACKIIVDRDKEDARVAFVTAHDIEDVREKADAVGAFGYISKPLKMKDIHEFLTGLEILNKKNKKDKIPSREPPKETSAVSSTSTNRAESKAGAAAKKRPTPPKKKTRVTKQYPPRNIKVLVAEDNLINQKVLDRILKRVGVTDITIVDNGKKAVDASEETRFDCILMDMQMPVMDGLEACKIIVKRDKDKEDCPKIIFVTAHALVEFREKALKAGAFDFITKPFKMEDIDNVLTKLLDAPPTQVGGEVVSDTSTTEMCTSSTSSEESASNTKPTKMPKLVHSLGE